MGPWRRFFIQFLADFLEPNIYTGKVNQLWGIVGVLLSSKNVSQTSGVTSSLTTPYSNIIALLLVYLYIPPAKEVLMSYTAEQLEKIATNYAQKTESFLEITAKKKEKKKLDPKAKSRNRGIVCVPAESAKDKKDHFPINDEGQARNALARVQQFSAAPPWYKGSLEGLKALVSRKVHSKYPSIGKADKKKKSSSVDFLLEKYAENDLRVSEELLNKYGQDENVWDTTKNLFRRKAPPVAAPATPVSATPAPTASTSPDYHQWNTYQLSTLGLTKLDELHNNQQITNEQFDAAYKALSQPSGGAKSKFPSIPKNVQQALMEKGFAGSEGLGPTGADGVLGPKTQAALERAKFELGRSNPALRTPHDQYSPELFQAILAYNPAQANSTTAETTTTTRASSVEDLIRKYSLGT